MISYTITDEDKDIEGKTTDNNKIIYVTIGENTNDDGCIVCSTGVDSGNNRELLLFQHIKNLFELRVTIKSKYFFFA